MNDGLFDKLLADSWPPAELVQWQGCRLRYTAGVTRRANSALPTGSMAPDDVISFVERAESFYSERKAPTQFQVSDHAGGALPDALIERGYGHQDETIVLWAELERMAGPSSGRSAAGWSLTIEDRCSDDWFGVYAAVDAGRHRSPDARPVLRRVLLAPPLPTRFVAAVGDGGVAAVGQVVVDGDVACGQCLATAPEARRKGAGAAVMGSLFEQAGMLAARRFIVAVSADNEASLALCRGVGFRESHRYRYFSVPPVRG